MATGDGRIHSARDGSAHGVTELVSLTHFSVGRSTVKSDDPGPAGSPGQADQVLTDRALTVTVYFLDEDEAMSLVEVAAANLVLNYVAQGGADWKRTIKNVVFNDPPAEVSTPEKRAGVPAGAVSISGIAKWGADDTFALMSINAADV